MKEEEPVIFRVRRSAAFAALLLILAGAAAQDYPTKPIRLIVPFAPGGGNDLIARVIGQKLTARWGQQIVVDNRPGAGGNIAAEITANSAPDGYTVFQFNIANAIAKSVYKKLAYDPVGDFAAVTQMASSAFFLVVHPSVPASTVKELIALAKARPGSLNYGSSGSGGSSHLMMELFKSMTGTDMTHIPYKGAGPALPDLLAGQIQLIFAIPATTLSLIKGGKLRALGVSSAKRNPLMPELPTVAEAGVPGFEGSAWYGVVVPARTARAIVNKLHEAIVAALHEPDVSGRLSSQGVEMVGSAPDAFAQFIKSEIAKWRKVVVASGAKVD
ncbi:MAG: tripartite tricarboxylate transporter substrate binding protein [Betaproteobacteria bacterium]|nr:tripartite tricarboxylate transporter substrate binding protein [Betaproteobacteria bacterium]